MDPDVIEPRVLDLGALKALAHPLRMEMYDILRQFGPQTATSLGELMGESSGAMSYHLRALARHGLIREVAGRGTTRERWWERPAGGVTLTSMDVMSTPAGRAASDAVMSEFLHRRQRQLLDYVAHAPEGEPEEWQRGALIASSTLRLTAAQLEELSGDVAALVEAAVVRFRDQTGEGVRTVTIHTDLFPIAPVTDPSPQP